MSWSLRLRRCEIVILGQWWLSTDAHRAALQLNLQNSEVGFDPSYSQGLRMNKLLAALVATLFAAGAFAADAASAPAKMEKAAAAASAPAKAKAKTKKPAKAASGAVHAKAKKVAEEPKK
jgi:hypothetical protein